MKVLLASVLFMVSVPLAAADFFVSGHGGLLLGYGVEGGLDFGTVRVRGQLNRFDYDRTESLDGARYDLTLELDSQGVLVDLRPFSSSGFHITAGLYDNDNAVDATSNEPVDIGGAMVSGVGVKTDFSGTASYLGLGWLLGRDNAGLVGSLELGVIGNGDADVTVTVPSGAGVSQADIDAEEKALESDLDDYGYLPVIKLGIGYYF